MSIERARSLVRNYTAYTKSEADITERIAQHMVKTGDCVWHATSFIVGTQCWCADCKAKSNSQ